MSDTEIDERISRGEILYKDLDYVVREKGLGNQVGKITTSWKNREYKLTLEEMLHDSFAISVDEGHDTISEFAGIKFI